MNNPIQDIADCLKAGISADAGYDTIKKFLAACSNSAIELKVDYWLDSGVNDLQAALIIRSVIIDRIGLINDTLVIALSRGYLLPDSPFPKIDKINSRRQIFQEVPLSFNDQIYLLNAARELSEIAKAHEEGKITFERKAAAQLSSYEVSVDGIAPQSGDPLTDILGYQPDGDMVKRKRAIDSLSKLDFSRRKAYLLFTMDDPKGIVVCWGRMRDASGYAIQRRDVFYSRELPEIILDNETLTKSTKDLLATDRFFQALSFYDWTGPQNIYAFVDDSVTADTLYSYRIDGIQKKAPASPFIFDVPMNALLFSPALADAVRTALQRDAERFARDINTISPYPALAEAVYGDPGYGWIVAGCNVLASIKRGDSVDQVRANSYIGASAERIFAEAQAGRVFIPSDLPKVQQAVDGAISAYGVSQTILSILDGTGVTHFVSGKDDPNGLQPTQQSIEGSTAGLARILSVVDPETATLDPKLITVSSQPRSARDLAVQIRNRASTPALQDVIEAGTIDLTTYSGISRLMQLLRTVYDFYPGAFV